MSNTEWKEVKLGDVCIDVYSGGTPKSSETSYYGGDIPWLNTKEVNFGRIFSTEKNITQEGYDNSSAKWVPANAVIVAMYGATAGRVAISKIKLTTNQACCNLIIDPKKADYNFVYYFLLQNYEHIASMANGGAQQNLNAGQIKDYKIQLPPLAEQQRIAKILGNLDDKIELNNAINRNLEEQINAFFKETFTNNLAFENMIQIPLSELCETVTKGTTPTTLGKNFVDNGINFIKAESIQENHSIEKDKFAYIDEDTNTLLKRSIIKVNDIIFTIAGSLGRFALIDESVLPANTNQAVAIIRVNAEKIAPEYVYSCFIGEWHKDYYSKRIQQAVQANLSLTTIKSLPIPILDNQKMSEYLQVIRPIIKLIKDNQIQTENLSSIRNSLLPKLMNGEQ